MSDAVTPSTLWLVDRSRIVDGRGFCQRARLLGYHIGPSGYGIQLKATKLPLMTGIGGHEGLAPILQWCQQHDDLILQSIREQPELWTGDQFLPVPTEVVRAAVKVAQQRYWKTVEVRGFAYLREDEAVQSVTREQCYLIEGMIWAWCLEVLPHILLRGRIVEVEVDDTYVFECTCGLGAGVLTKADHESRGCHGMGIMCRPDFLVEQRISLELEYHEFKTTSLDSIVFRDKWETMIQMFAAVLDAERRLGRQIQSIYIHGLVKGRREGDYNPDTGKKDGTIRQNSIFCYGYRKPAIPPMEAEEWAGQYEWFDTYEQKNRRLGKAFRKTGVWDLPDQIIPEEMSKAEYWVKWIPPEARRKNLVLMGPLSRQQQMVDHFVEETKGEEARWQEAVWQLYDLGQQILEQCRAGCPDCGGANSAICSRCDGRGYLEADWWDVVWPDTRFQALMDRLIPRSYECRRYGMRNRCGFEDICLQREGWGDPIASGRYVERRPHHRDELEQAIARGLLLADDGLAEEPEWELP